jgi:uncharacterized protein
VSISVLLVTGQSSQYHDWTRSSAVLEAMLESANGFEDPVQRFLVTLCRSPAKGEDMSAFRPPFGDFAAVLVDYEGDDWPDETKRDLEHYVQQGGGLVIYHAADNAFPYWKEWQVMCGLGGWAGRDESWGPKVRWRSGATVLDDSPGTAMHPPRHDFTVTSRAPQHPIMEGVPETWLQPNDEIYSQLRGPATQLAVLATAWADAASHPKATGEHEPVLMTVRYGHGRVFHTTLGHVGPADVEPLTPVMSSGFVTTLRRGTEWAATGRVTQ